jgi:putative Ca2+/H+ antiporter (TMEM165/GDT1 family)
MSLAIAITVFALIFPAELPDKTFIATLVLSTRYKAWPVFVGSMAGFAVQSGIAVAVGGAVSLLPKVWVHGVSAAIFAIGAVLLLRQGNGSDEEEADEAEAGPPTSWWRGALTSFLVLFVAEWGDLTQLLTASLAAKYHDPLSVFVGSWLALIAVAALAVTGGKALMRVLPLDWVRRAAGVAFAAVAVVTALEAADVF